MGRHNPLRKRIVTITVLDRGWGLSEDAKGKGVASASPLGRLTGR